MLEVGSIVKARVTSIKPFGAFALLEDHNYGLIHISEFSDDFVRDISQIVKVGEQIEVKILSVDPDGRYKLSYKSVEGNHTKIKSFVDTTIGFTSIEKNLPKWKIDAIEKFQIKEGLEK